MVAPSRGWSKTGFVLSGGGLVLALAATLVLEIVRPAPVLWALPALGIAVGLAAGASAFWTLRHDLKPYTPRLAAASSGVALLSLAAGLVAIIAGIGAVARRELPTGIAVGSSALALSAFIVTALLVAVATWRGEILPRWVAGGLVVATTLLLGAPVSVIAIGAVPAWLLPLLLATWAAVLLLLSRSVPSRA